MKKLLTILGSVGMIATTSAAVIACGDKTSKKTPDTKPTEEKKEEEKEKTEETKKEESKKEEKKEEDIEHKFSEVNGKLLGNFEPNENNIVEQSKIKKELVGKLKVKESELQSLEVDYEKKAGSVVILKFSKKLDFKFTTIYDLGEIESENKNGTTVTSQLKIKEALAKKLKTETKNIQGLNVNYNNNTGTAYGPKSSNLLEFKFSVKNSSPKQSE
ncbi:lipoprotein [Mycoplasma sp. 06067-C1-B144P-99-0482-3]|uniref:lipoprotein n=1 Tax=Mycoplasma sp. 06067-C1-B144P-99-0482-3 TaxID=3117438 RepID=UPI003DA266B8